MAFENVEIQNDHGDRGVGRVATFGYDTDEGERLVVVTALSPTGLDGALANLKAEGASDDSRVITKQPGRWNDECAK